MLQADTVEAHAAHRQAFEALFRALRPDPKLVLELTSAYVDARVQAQQEEAREAWLGDWLARREAWLGRVGPMLTAADVAEASPTMKSAAAVHKARGEGRLAGLEIGDRVYFPAFQFKRDGTPAAWVRDVVAALPDADAVLQFFAAARPALGDKSYAEALGGAAIDDEGIAGMVRDARAVGMAEAR